MEKPVPENAGILGNVVFLPKTELHQRLETHGVGGESREAFRPLLLHHLPESSGVRDHARERRSFPDIVGIDRNRLVGSAVRIFNRQEMISQNEKILRRDLSVNIKRGNHNVPVGNFKTCLRRQAVYVFFYFAPGPGGVGTLAENFAGEARGMLGFKKMRENAFVFFQNFF